MPIKMELSVYVDPDRNGFIDCMSLIKGEMMMVVNDDDSNDDGVNDDDDGEEEDDDSHDGGYDDI